MLDISSDAIAEKNKITSDGTWLILLEISYEGDTPLYVCLNNESIEWDSKTWLPAIFKLSGMQESRNAEVPNINLSLYDINRSIIPILEELNGAIGAIVTIRIVHSKFLSNTTAELTEVTEIIESSVSDTALVNIILGAANLLDRICPAQRYLKNNCRFIFKKALMNFTAAGTIDLNSPYYIKGDTSGNKGLIREAQIESGDYAGNTAAGLLIFSTISGPFQTETISLYSDSDFTILIQAAAASVTVSNGNCGYAGGQTDCNRSFSRCQELSNSTRFGGFIGVGVKGFIK